MTQQEVYFVLDIDEVLLHTIKSESYHKTTLNKKANWITEESANFLNGNKISFYHFYLRPHLKLFLQEIKKHYQLALWSSSANDYVSNIFKNLLQESELTEKDFFFVWSQERTVKDYSNTSGFHDYENIKDLIKIRRRGVDITKVLFVDDHPNKLKRNYGNLIQAKPFYGKEDDTHLLSLLEYLIFIKNTENFRKLEKRYWNS
jgi:RNA polymerase II subunit A small phosphatase-like protein